MNDTFLIEIDEALDEDDLEPLRGLFVGLHQRVLALEPTGVIRMAEEATWYLRRFLTPVDGPVEPDLPPSGDDDDDDDDDG